MKWLGLPCGYLALKIMKERKLNFEVKSLGSAFDDWHPPLSKKEVLRPQCSVRLPRAKKIPEFLWTVFFTEENFMKNWHYFLCMRFLVIFFNSVMVENLEKRLAKSFEAFLKNLEPLFNDVFAKAKYLLKILIKQLILQSHNIF